VCLLDVERLDGQKVFFLSLSKLGTARDQRAYVR